MNFVRAANFTPTKGRVVDLIVLHTMEAPEKGDTAESVARYFHNKSVQASAHYCIDNDSIVQCVEDRDVAWAAPGANHNGLQLEHAGYARQGAAEWHDDYSHAMLRVSAALAADKIKQYGLPVVFRNAADLSAGGERARGITTHFEVSRAFRKSDHTDPGIGFVIDEYLGFVNEALNPRGVAMQRFTDAVDAALIPGWRAPDGRPGVWVVKPDGGVFTYPDGAPFLGSMGGKPLNAPMSGIVAYKSPSGDLGYWLIGQDGGIFAFGAAPAVVPYSKFGDEFRVGAHAMVDAEFDGHALVCLADDGGFYTYTVQ
jgi:hypothetical protein